MSTHNLHFDDKIIIKKSLKYHYFFSCAIGGISEGLKNEFESATANEPSVFELLKFYYTVTEVIKVISVLHAFTETK